MRISGTGPIARKHDGIVGRNIFPTIRRLAWLVALQMVALGLAVAPLSSQELSEPPTASTLAQDGPGKILFVNEGNLWLWERGETRPLTTGGVWRQPQWSPDGSQIAFTLWMDNFSDIYVMAADGSDLRQLTRSQSVWLEDNDWATRPAWSPDGSKISFLSDAASLFPMLWIMNADGTGRRALMRPVAGIEAADSYSWSPAGDAIAVTAFRGGQGQIFLLDLEWPASLRQLTEHAEGALDPAWSPDGQYIAYVAREGGQMSLYVMRRDGSTPQRLLSSTLLRSPTWFPDGGYLSCLMGGYLGMDLVMLEVHTDSDGHISVGNKRQLTRNLAIDGVSGLSWAR